MTHSTRITALLTVLAAIVSTVGCGVFATHEEYGRYRAVRYAEDDRARLIAMAQYVESHPGGFWAGEINAQRRMMEDGVWERSNDSVEGVQWYLQVYPDGQYVEQARPILAALGAVDEGRSETDARQSALQQQRQQQTAEQARTWVTRSMQFWTTTLLGIRNYGQPIQRVVEGNAEFNRAFGEPPQPQCAPEYCIKHFGQQYHIPVPGATRLDRRMDVFLRLALTRGRVDRAELILPNKGFSRWYEMENRTVVTDEDPEQRNAAINWVLERLQPMIEQGAPGARRVDFVPEPIPALQVTGRAANAPSGKQQGDIDDLLDSAVGNQPGQRPQQQQQQQQQPQAQPEASATMVLPVGLISWEFRNLRIVVFAAGADDYDQGYDGLFIERTGN